MRKKILIAIFIVIGFFVLSADRTEASERFAGWSTPKLKEFYCGSVLDFRYCKCAFHGEYCEALGIDSATSNGIVQNGYNTYVSEQKNLFFNGCKKAGGHYITNSNGAEGCLYCYAPDFFDTDGCKNISELCSDDPRVTWDETKRLCFCPAGYTLSAGNICESVCGDDPNIYYNLETNNCSCRPGYEMNRENGEEICQELPEIDLIIEEVTPDGKMPYLADGKKTGIFKIKATYLSNDRPVDLKINIRYSTTGKPGTITAIEGDSSEYTVHYQTSDLKDTDIVSGKDVLYLFYDSPKLGEQIYKTFDINLVNSEAVTVEVSKHGFKTTETQVYFVSDKSSINVYTTNSKGEKVPIRNAKIDHSGYFTSYTDKEGKAQVNAPSEIESSGMDLPDTEVLLVLTDSIEKYRSDAREQYNDLIVNYAQLNETIKDFIVDFESYLAKQPNENEAKKAVAGIDQMRYALFYIKQGLKMGKDSSDALAESIGNAIWDLTDLLGVFDALKNPIKDYLNKATGGTNIDIADHVSQTFKMDFANRLVEVYAEGKNGVVRSFINNIRVVAVRAVIGTNQFSPNWLDRVLKEAIDAVSSEGINAVGDSISLKNLLSNELQGLNKDMADDLLSSIAGAINNNSFNEYGEGYLQSARDSYVQFADWYLQKHALEYNATMVKQWTELGFNIAGKAAKILYPKTAGKIVDFMETVYKGLRSGVINNVQLATWISAYTRNQDMMYKNVNMIIPVKLSINEVDDGQHAPFAQIAYAGEEADVLQNLYISDIKPENPDFEKAVQYVQSQSDLEFYSSLQSITEMLVLADPEDAEIIALHERISGEKTDAEKNFNTVKSRMDELGLTDPNYGSKSGTVELIIGFIVIGVGLLIFILIIRYIIKKIRRK